MPGRRQFTDDFYAVWDLPTDLRRKIESFLSGYSEGEGHEIDLSGSVDSDDALALLDEGRKAFRKHRG